MKRTAEHFIRDLIEIRDYWVKTGNIECYTTEQTCEGMLFSILSYLDGSALLSPSIALFDTNADGSLGASINAGIDLHELYTRLDSSKEGE